jgi:hypothetical protein
VNHKVGEVSHIQIIDRKNVVREMHEFSQSMLRILSDYRSFIPRVYVSSSTYDLMEKEGLLIELQKRFAHRKKTA